MGRLPFLALLALAAGLPLRGDDADQESASTCPKLDDVVAGLGQVTFDIEGYGGEEIAALQQVPRSSAGDLVWYVWDGLRSQELKPPTPVSPPTGRWFHVEAFVRQATDRSGRTAIWIDGEPFVDQSGVSTVPSHRMSWTVGSVSLDIAEQPADIYIDDAMIWGVGTPP
jgi:hypothetical protein